MPTQAKGYFINEGQKSPINYKEFNIENEYINGYGSDSVGDYKIKGELGFDGYTFNFQKQYDDFTLYYKGQLFNQKTVLTGYWGYEDQDEAGKFYIELFQTEKNRQKFSYLADSMKCGNKLKHDYSLLSQNRKYLMIFQGDSNLVLYRFNKEDNSQEVIWSSGTDGQNGKKMCFQDDGNLVIYNHEDEPIWAADCSEKGGEKAVMQNDGNFVVYTCDDELIWATNTNE